MSGSPDDGQEGYLLFNQRWIEGLSSKELDLEDVDAVLWQVFSGLPQEVVVYPSENYYYFLMYVGGRQIWGNIRLPTRVRDQGLLSFAYFEFNEFPSGSRVGRFTRSKFYSQPDGLNMEKVDDFTYRVTYRGKTVTFNLHRLPQEPPKMFPLGEEEVFLERTFDESAYQFFLLFNDKKNYFLWVLNEEEGLHDILEPVGADLLVGKRSGFAFWIDRANGNRKVLAAVRRLSVSRNDYYDGPFDQLADNYAEEVGISEYMQRALPGLRGRIDTFGYRTDKDRSLRVALSNYHSYTTLADLNSFMERAKASDDVYWYISRRGGPKQTAVVPTPQALAPVWDDPEYHAT